VFLGLCMTLSYPFSEMIRSSLVCLRKIKKEKKKKMLISSILMNVRFPCEIQGYGIQRSQIP
jgi:hypothetical protein